MNVMLVSYTPDPERLVAIAARQCYSPLGAAELAEGLSDEKVGDLIRTIIEAGHLSPTEHASFTFAIEGVSRALSHQLVRHRIASYSQQSQRYVNEQGFDYVVPPSVAANEQARRLFEEQMERARDAYRALVELVPREDARFVLPNACGTRLVVTMNCRSLYNFFERRLCERAQWEIRDLARAMLERVREVAPRLFSWVGPPCEVRGWCPEGKMSCGRVESVSRRLIAATDVAKDNGEAGEDEGR
ncbi:MAG: FAD-dependent thymidylate synthase [Bacillota bacterium]|nr:FAD-dependent thymidylate synthase [Bacillota bacterium]